MKKFLITLLGYNTIFVTVCIMFYITDVVTMKSTIFNPNFWISWVVCMFIIGVLHMIEYKGDK